MPVLRNHSGLLLGNDFLGAVRADLSYGSTTDGSDGSLTLRSKDGCVASKPVPFVRGKTVPMLACYGIVNRFAGKGSRFPHRPGDAMRILHTTH